MCGYIQTTCFSTKDRCRCFLIQVQERSWGHIQAAFYTCSYCYHSYSWPKKLSGGHLSSCHSPHAMQGSLNTALHLLCLSPFIFDAGTVTARLRRCSGPRKEDSTATVTGKDVLCCNNTRGPGFRGARHLQGLTAELDTANRKSKSLKRDREVSKSAPWHL